MQKYIKEVFVDYQNDNSFKDDHLPNGIYSLTYVVDLTDIEYEPIDIDKMA